MGWPLRQTRKRVDDGGVGIGFVDVLFALVIGKILDAMTWSSLHPVWTIQHANLGVAAALTLASWIGYHNSVNRPKFKIRFFNLPLVQFCLDIGMVGLYWLAAVVAGASSRTNPLTVELARITFEAFVLYFLWDLTSALIGRNSSYQKLLEEHQDWANEERWSLSVPRAISTPVCALTALGVWIAAERGAFRTLRGAYLADGLLVAIIVIFRLWKDTRREPTASADTAEEGVRVSVP